MSTIVSIVEDIASTDPERVLSHFGLKSAGSTHSSLTYGRLVSAARQVARAVNESSAGIGTPVVLLLPSGPDLMIAFYGVMLAGRVPTIFPINPSRVGVEKLRRGLQKSLSLIEATLVLTDEESRARFFDPQTSEGEASLNGVDVLSPEQWQKLPALLSLPTPEPDAVAFLQHSSGTTGQKKGVAITHRALLTQVGSYSRAIALRPDDVIASWLPLYHDMGLIACFMLPLVSGVQVITLDAFEWVSSPQKLLRVIDAHDATLCWLPNFAHILMAERVTEAASEGMRFSSLRAIINCSEPITAHAQDALLLRFAPQGLKPEMLTTCYAMAENTFAVTQSPMGERAARREVDLEAMQVEGRIRSSRPGHKSRLLVSSGTVIAGSSVLIVDEEGRPKAEGELGEIAITSDCMLSGYHRRPELSQKAIKNGFFHTGDIGFLDGEQLYVTGRKKDLLIVAGRNIHPEDVENLVSAVDGVRGGRTVAFPQYDESLGTDNLIVLAEVQDNPEGDDAPMREALIRAIESAVANELSISPREVVLLSSGQLIKSTSGKISRSACKIAYESGDFEALPTEYITSDIRALKAPRTSAEGAPTMSEEPPAFAFQQLILPILITEWGIQGLSLLGPASLIYWARFSPFALAPAILAGFYLYMISVIFLCGLTIWLCPKPKPGTNASIRDRRRFAFISAIYILVERTPAQWFAWIQPFPAYFFLKLCGAKIAADVTLAGSLNVRDPFLTEIGEGTVLGGGSLIGGHWIPRPGVLHLGRVKIGRKVLIGRNASVWADVTIGDNAVIREGSAVMPGTIVGEGEVWGGIPARRLSGGLSAKSGAKASDRSVSNVPATLPASRQEYASLIFELLTELRGRDVGPVDTSVPFAETGVVDSLRFLELCSLLQQRTRLHVDSDGDLFREASIESLSESLWREALATAA